MTNPRTLDGNRVNFLSMSVSQSLTPLSTAQMEVFKEDVLPIRTYVEIETPNGVKEFYRTRQPQESQGSNIATIQLDHAICEVGDYMIQDVIDDAMTVREAFVAVFDHYRGNKWQLGTFTATETVIVDADYDNVLETLLSILEQQPKYIMTFNFTTSPWTVSVEQKSDTVTAEGRLSRNIAEAVVRRDDKDLCTRVYVKGLPKPTGREDDENAIGYMDADTLSLYGIVEKQTGSGNLTQEQAELVATAYLNAHKNPKLSVEIDGDDLSELTGETLDSFRCGKKFRLVVPDDNLIIEDYITKVSFSDVLSPVASIVIGEDLDPAINFLQDQASKSKSSGRGAKRQERENATIHTEIYATGSMLYSYIEQTATSISLVVENAESRMGSAIHQTAEEIYSEVHAANSTIYSYISQTATNIRSRVEDVNDDLHSEIEQTKSMIRSAVWTANSIVYSYVDQTASYILDHVGERTGSKVIPSMTEPEDSPDNPLNTGDIWIEGTMLNVWDDMEGEPWIDYDPTHPEYDWSQLKGQKVYTWKDGKWNLCLDETTIAEDTDFLRTKEAISMIAYNQKVVDGEYRANVARLDVKADKISANVEERVQQIGSNITQTANQIRSEVHASQSQLYSAIEQTATSIRAYVVDKANDLGSEILQTASQIRMEVHSSNSTIYSTITQTATSIRSEVADTAGNLSSRITQTANKVSIVVDDNNNLKTASIVAGINAQTGSYVTIQADKINLTGYVTASQLNTQKARIDNLISGDSMFDLMRATRATLGNSNSTGVTIYGQTVRVYSVIDAYGTRRQVFGYTLS